MILRELEEGKILASTFYVFFEERSKKTASIGVDSCLLSSFEFGLSFSQVCLRIVLNCSRSKRFSSTFCFIVQSKWYTICLRIKTEKLENGKSSVAFDFF
jgi:hypothetical protein